MGNVVYQFAPENGVPLGSAFPQPVKANGSAFPVSGLAFDAANDEAIFFPFKATNYGSGNLTVSVDGYAAATANNVVLEAQIAALTPGDAQSVLTKALSTLNYVQGAPSSTSNGPARLTITITNLDSIAAGDLVYLRLARDANGTNATDDMTGDFIVTFVELSYSDS